MTIGLVALWVARKINIPKVLNDLAGYAKGLTQKVYMLEQKIQTAEVETEEENKKAESATVEQ
jgi:hypothetical protein